MSASSQNLISPTVSTALDAVLVQVADQLAARGDTGVLAERGFGRAAIYFAIDRLHRVPDLKGPARDAWCEYSKYERVAESRIAAERPWNAAGVDIAVQSANRLWPAARDAGAALWAAEEAAGADRTAVFAVLDSLPAGASRRDVIDALYAMAAGGAS